MTKFFKSNGLIRIHDIQQNDIGHLFDVEYVVSLTIRMLALLSQYSSQHVIFHVANSNVDYDPATMMVRLKVFYNIPTAT